MTSNDQIRLSSARRLLVRAGMSALVVAVVLAWFQPQAIWPAYRFALFACLAPAIGSLVFALVHRCTGGAWGVALEPFLAAGGRLAPWIWLFIAPLVWKAPSGDWPHYESRAMLAVRAVAYAVILFGVATSLVRSRAAWVGPVGLLALLFTLHVLSDDWLVALDPGWSSTAFSLVWLLGQSVAGLGCAVLGALVCGVSPNAGHESPTRALGIDWGNLLLTAMLLWCYVAFAQFLIIWAGNLPREISWYERRVQDGWVVVPVLLLGLHFVAPLTLLLSRRAKRSVRTLGTAAGLLVLAQFIYVAWVILPAFPLAQTGPGLLTGFAFGAGALAFWLRLTLTRAAGRLEQP